MSSVIFAAVADDDTGATDLAGMLATQGVRTVQVIGIPPAEQLNEWTREADAVVLAAGTRAAPAGSAYETTRRAIRALAALTPRTFAVKYCSTFDSTEAGNIGPSIDAALDELGEAFTVALPALPVNGRTTYMGYHFVHEQLLSDSPMRHHPLTPMTNPHLVSHLQSQTGRRVGLTPHTVVRQGVAAVAGRFEALRRDGVAIAVLDCVSDADLGLLCEAMLDLRLITGGSGPGMKLPAFWRQRGWWRPGEPARLEQPERPSGCLIVAGSCSAATQAQKDWWTAQGGRTFRLDPISLVTGELKVSGAIAAILTELNAGRSVLVETASSRDDVERVHEWAARTGRTPTGAGLEIANRVAALCARLFAGAMPAGLVVAGGETSTAICRALELGALRIGNNIDPGVPLCESLGRYRLPVVLKSGNFGTEDFFGKAESAVRGGAQESSMGR